MTANPEIKVVESCGVAPPADAATEFTVPLSFLDMQWLVSDAHHHIHFFRLPNPSSSRPTSIISSIKSSLSLVLKHFLPLAGNLIWPLDSDTTMPELRYKIGDSVSLTIVESNMEYDYLVGDHQRESYKFCNLFPQLPEPYLTTGSRVSPVFALQVTLFRKNTGICIGRTVQHVLGDATSFILFNKLWVLLDKSNEDSLKLLIAPSSRPLYDRSAVQDPYHLRLKILNEKKLLLKSHCTTQSTPTIHQNPTLRNKDEVRATFILHPIDITKLKKFVSSRNTSNNSPSAFTVTCALIWTCLLKSFDHSANETTETEEDKDANLCAYINYRQRFDPPIPQNYFGNCTVPCMVEANHGQLVGKEGLWVAATTVGDAIHKRLNDNQGFLRGDWMSSPPLPATTTTTTTTARRNTNTFVYIIGSAQRHLHDYDADFGWGKMEKHEYVSTADSSSATVMLITRSRRFKGAIELSTSLPKNKMDYFSAILTDSINNLNIRSPL